MTLKNWAVSAGRQSEYILLTTLIAITAGLYSPIYFLLEKGLNVESGSDADSQKPLRSAISSFPSFQAIRSPPWSTGIFCKSLCSLFFFGIAINFSGPKGKPLLHFMESLADVMYRLTSLIMEFSPVGVFGIMAWVTGTFGLTLLLPLFKFLGSLLFSLPVSAYRCLWDPFKRNRQASTLALF